MISMNNVCFSYRQKRRNRDILVDLSMQFVPGEVYAIYGPSGVGKTTCLSVLGGLDTPTKGSIEIDGTDIKTIGYSQLRKQFVSFVFQDYHLFPYMTAIENVVVAASIANKSKGHEAKEQATALLSSLGLDSDTIRRPISQISGGQQQRTAIARALIKNPTYILADEPTGNLDKENAQVIMGILVDLAHKQNKCIIIATHSDLVCAHADVTMKMEDGKLFVEGK